MDNQKQGLDKEYGDWKSKSNLPQGWKMKTPSYLNHVSYSASNKHDVEEHIEYEITNEKDLLESITKVVYQYKKLD